MWETVEAIHFIRELELKLSPLGFHCGFAGGVLLRGSSTKDLDIVVYPHDTRKPGEFPWPEIIEFCRATYSRKCDSFSDLRDDKDVRMVTTPSGKRIDFFFLK